MNLEILNVGDRDIHLTQVLKLAGWAENGGQAKAIIAEGLVRVNGQIEMRKRRQMVIGDTVQLEDGPTLILARDTGNDATGEGGET